MTEKTLDKVLNEAKLFASLRVQVLCCAVARFCMRRLLALYVPRLCGCVALVSLLFADACFCVYKNAWFWELWLLCVWTLSCPKGQKKPTAAGPLCQPLHSLQHRLSHEPLAAI